MERTVMIWVILAALGVPLWLCAVAILTLVLRNRSLRKRAGDISVRLRTAPEKRWRRGHALWVHDVLSFRASPAGWSESLVWTTALSVRAATAEERKKLHRLGDRPVIALIALKGGETVEAGASAEARETLMGPYAEADADARVSPAAAPAAAAAVTPTARQ
jgi:hypothetical protein